MGGKDGSRGYLYQALVAVLDAIEKDDWIEVYLEYETDNDKVDIAFKDTNENLEVIQVKSSINNFSKSDINKWLIELIEDKPNANKFKLELIGTGESNTTKYINSIKKISKNKSDKTSDEISQTIPELILSNVNKVDIEILNNDMGSFEKSIGFTIYKLLDTNGYSVPAKMIDLIVGGITYQFNKLCTSGDFVSRDEFIENILEWASYNYDLNRENNIKKYFDIKYYYGNQFYDKLDEDIRIDINEKDKEVEKIKLQIEDISNELEKINLTQNKNEHQFEKMGFNESLSKAMNMYNKIQDFEQSITISTEKSMLNNRKEGLLEKLSEYLDYLDIYDDLREYFKYLSKYKILPLSLKNISKKYLEDITLTLKVPKNLEILNEDNIITPYDNIIEYVQDILEELLCGVEDSNIKEFKGFLRAPHDIFNYMKNKSDKFIDFIEDKFNYKVFDNEKGYTILQCNFRDLNPHDVMYLPMNLMIKSNDEFEIEYSIKCKNMSKIQTGKIKA